MQRDSVTVVSGLRIPCRLDKFIRDSIGWSRKRVIRGWEEGRIEVVGDDDDPIRSPGMLVFDGDEVRVDGRPVEPIDADTYLILNKPGDVVTTSRDPAGRRSLSAWLEPLNPRTFPVGRLDLETTGLLILTDDGDLAHLLLHPKHHVEKTYVLTLGEAVSDGDERLQRLREGVEIKGGTARALSITVEDGPSREVRMVIDEGRNRQVRRMCKAAHLVLDHLHRERIGPLFLDAALEPGELRSLNDDEVESLWRALGGRANVRALKIAALRRKAVHLRESDRIHHRLEQWLDALGEMA